MRAIVCAAPGEPEGLQLLDLPAPALAPGSVRIAVEACGVNFADLLLVRGEYQERPAHPFVPGMEVAGTVIEVAAGVSAVRPGDRVAALLDHGGFAEQAVAPARAVVRLPDAMDTETAAGFLVAYLTSHLALCDRARVQPGEVVLVHGAAGGVGLTAVEIAHAVGATVIAAASGAERRALVAGHGANHVLDSRTDDIRARVLALTGGASGGVDVVYDPVGGATFDASLRCVRPGGRMLLIGFASGTVPQIPANHLLVKDVAALGFSLPQTRRRRPEAVHAALTELLAWYAAGRLHPLVSAVMPLADAPRALQALRDRQATGKIVLVTGAGAASAH